jgi:hypothetical protein
MRFFSLHMDKEILGDLVKERQNVVFIKWYKKTRFLESLINGQSKGLKSFQVYGEKITGLPARSTRYMKTTKNTHETGRNPEPRRRLFLLFKIVQTIGFYPQKTTRNSGAERWQY